MDRLKNALSGMSGWLKFLGIVNIIVGILLSLTLVGIIGGILTIWLGVLLFQAGNRASEYVLTESQESLFQWAEKLKTYFIIMGILTILGVIFMVLAFIFYGFAIMQGIQYMQSL